MDIVYSFVEGEIPLPSRLSAHILLLMNGSNKMVQIVG